jgi:hypothetical protein
MGSEIMAVPKREDEEESASVAKEAQALTGESEDGLSM